MGQHRPKPPPPPGTVVVPKGDAEGHELAIMEFLQSYINEHDYSPSIAEIGRHINRSHPTVLRHLKTLEDKGYIKSAPKHRTITIVTN